MKDGQNKIDWPGFCVHFVCGALVGGVIGLRCWMGSDWALSTSATPGVLIIFSCALFGGLLAGLGKDDVWSGIGEGINEGPWMMIKIVCYAVAAIGLIWLFIRLFALF